MIKYFIISLIGYYVFTYYLSPMIEGKKHTAVNNNKKQKSEKNHDDEYVDYEEVD